MQVLQGMILYLENLHNTSQGEIGGSGKAARGVEDAAPYAPPYGSRRGEHCSPAGSCVTAQPRGSIWNAPLRSKQSRDALTGRRGGFYIRP